MSSPAVVEPATKDAEKSPAVPTTKGYSVPGEGRSTLISVVTVCGLFALWWVATHYGWIKDLFLPTPEKIFTSFGDAWRGDIQGGKPLSEHFKWNREMVSTAYAVMAITAAISSPIIGYMLDRVPVRRVVTPCLAIVGCGFAFLALLRLPVPPAG